MRMNRVVNHRKLPRMGITGMRLETFAVLRRFIQELRLKQERADRSGDGASGRRARIESAVDRVLQLLFDSREISDETPFVHELFFREREHDQRHGERLSQEICRQGCGVA